MDKQMLTVGSLLLQTNDDLTTSLSNFNNSDCLEKIAITTEPSLSGSYFDFGSIEDMHVDLLGGLVPFAEDIKIADSMEADKAWNMSSPFMKTVTTTEAGIVVDCDNSAQTAATEYVNRENRESTTAGTTAASCINVKNTSKSEASKNFPVQKKSKKRTRMPREEQKRRNRASAKRSRLRRLNEMQVAKDEAHFLRKQNHHLKHRLQQLGAWAVTISDHLKAQHPDCVCASHKAQTVLNTIVNDAEFASGKNYVQQQFFAQDESLCDLDVQSGAGFAPLFQSGA